MNTKARKNTLFIVQAGLIAAVYVTLTAVSNFFNLAYGEVQFRLSEALTVLPVFTPAAVPGLVIGCLISNIFSPMGFYDVIFGTAATLMAALLTRALRNLCFKGLPVMALIPPVLCNAVIVGIEITLFLSDEKATFAGFALMALFVGLGQLAVCFGLGLPLAVVLKRTRLFDRFEGGIS